MIKKLTQTYSIIDPTFNNDFTTSVDQNIFIEVPTPAPNPSYTGICYKISTLGIHLLSLCKKTPNTALYSFLKQSSRTILSGLLGFKNFESLVFDVFLSKTEKSGVFVQPLLNNDGQVVMRLANFADDGVIYDQYYLEYFLHDAKTYFENRLNGQKVGYNLLYGMKTPFLNQIKDNE